ncbi:AAA family ATPase [Archaeoglobus veneficus]|uniref:SMC domain protein n=1 Tax=Archaeoglobus veneficus (strain DSM 11195 / SNP6) TaxID=693661 RepID=F2KSN4_ARCVS|nr:AAA family ATPase [Archaeoglobus veneficus]AEA48104.1 SMC domain protein [Archaeoglobus veneficus SNP6]
MIKEVRLVNVKSYSDSVIRFTEGVNAIIGENGAGKTTILEAIGFALFDSLPYKIGDFLRRGEKRGEIRVRLVGRDDREYEIVRKIEEGRTTAYYVNDLELGRVAEGSAEVMDWILENFGFEVDAKTVFENAIGVQQGKMVSHFLEPPSVRDSIFSPLIGVESYRKAFEKSREYENYVRDRLQDVEKKLVALSKDIEAKQRAESKLEELRKRRDELRKQLEEIERVIEPLRKKIERMDALSREFDKLALDEARLAERIKAEEKAIQEIEKEIKRIEEFEKEFEKLRESAEAYLSAEKRIAELEQQESELNKAYRFLLDGKIKLESLKAEISSIERLLDDISQKERILDEVSRKAEKEKSLNERLREFEVISAKKAEVDKRLDALEKEIEEKRKKIEDLEEKRRKLKDLEEKLEKLEDVDKARDKLLKAISGLRAKLELARKQYAQMKDGVCPILREGCDRIAGARDEKLAEIEKEQEKLIEMERKFEKAQKVFEKKKQIEDAISRLRGELRGFDSLKEELGEKEALVKALRSERESLDKKLKEKDAILKEFEEVKGSIEMFAALQAEVEKKKPLLKELREKRETLKKIEEKLQKMPEIEKNVEEIRRELTRLRAVKEEKKEDYVRYIGLSETVAGKSKLVEDVERRRKELDELGRKYRDVKERLERIAAEYSKEEHEKLRENLNELVGKASMRRGELESVEREINSVERDVKELEKKEEEYKELKARKEQLEKKYAFIKDLREIFRIAIPEITRAYVETVSIEANRIFCELMDDYSWELRWTEDFGIKARYLGREIDLAQMSGGEQMCAALAVRLALLRVLSNVSMVFFDEPTQNMDENRRKNFAAQISRIEGFRQIFVISHDDTFEEMVENAIKVRRENGVSVVE